MPDINKYAEVPYTPAEMYDLVNDIEKYPEFLPWCKGAEVIVDNDDERHATLILSAAGMEHSFTTMNLLQKHKMIEMRLLNGPFKHLEGFWRFELHGDNGCKVCFDLEFEFISTLISLMVGPIFHQVLSTLVDAFVKRAEEIYGKR